MYGRFAFFNLLRPRWPVQTQPLRILAALICVVCLGNGTAKATDKPLNLPQLADAGKQIIRNSATAGPTTAPRKIDAVENASDTYDKKVAERHREQEATNSRFTMIFTGCSILVALAQLGFFWWQLTLMRASIKDTGVAAKAAELSARAAVGIELPILRFIPDDLVDLAVRLEPNAPYGGRGNDGAPGRFSAVGDIKIMNYGRTPAFPEMLAVGWLVAERLPDMPAYIQHDKMNHASVVRPGEEFGTGTHYGIELTNADLSALESGAWLWFYGSMTYTDFLDESREARFCWRYANRNFDNVFFSFASDGQPPAQYTKQSRA